MFRAWVIAGVAALAFSAAGQARAAVTVIGGGMAQACSEAALGGETDLKFQEICSQALETEFLNNRDRAGTFINRGVLKLRRGSYVEATRDFNQAVRIKPDMGEAYVNRGAAAVGQRLYAQSLDDLNKGLELGVKEPAKVYYNRALAYEGMDDPKSAYFDYQKALEIDPAWDAPREQLTRFSVSRR
ncbi:MAG TPA: tetratricopeptide repeat protein [Phenylobacterium sp.]|nr:tetratricopeptide repeat protein [Phenylobacterium sp.]